MGGEVGGDRDGTRDSILLSVGTNWLMLLPACTFATFSWVGGRTLQKQQRAMQLARCHAKRRAATALRQTPAALERHIQPSRVHKEGRGG